MYKGVRCRYCAMRLEDIQGRRTTLMRLLKQIDKYPESSKVEAHKAEILKIKAKIKEDRLLVDSCECTIGRAAAR